LVGGYLGREASRSGHAAPSPSPPAAHVAVDARVRAAEAGVVKVVSLQPACGWQVQSTGFAFSLHHVITLASDIAGSARGGLHVVNANGMSRAARVVLFDPALNIAVLDVPTLSMPTLSMPTLGFASTFVPYSRVVFVGYVHDDPRPTVTAGIATASETFSHGLHGGKVSLQILLIQAKAAAGDSGGPVLDQAGQVDGIIEGNVLGSSSDTYALSNLQVQSDVAQSADRSTAVSDGRCVSNQK
jgi:S1-C subfamily serine protease